MPSAVLHTTFSSLPRYTQLPLIFFFLIVPIAILFIWIDHLARQRARGSLYGFGGWLLLLAFYFYYRFLVTIIQSLSYLAKSSHLFRTHPYIILYAESSLNFISILGNAIMLYLMATKSHRFLLISVIVNIWTVLIPLFDFISAYFFANVAPPKELTMLVLSFYYMNTRILAIVIFPLISIVYVIRSARVRNTFVN